MAEAVCVAALPGSSRLRRAHAVESPILGPAKAKSPATGLMPLPSAYAAGKPFHLAGRGLPDALKFLWLV